MWKKKYLFVLYRVWIVRWGEMGACLAFFLTVMGLGVASNISSFCRAPLSAASTCTTGLLERGWIIIIIYNCTHNCRARRFNKVKAWLLSQRRLPFDEHFQRELAVLWNGFCYCILHVPRQSGSQDKSGTLLKAMVCAVQSIDHKLHSSRRYQVLRIVYLKIDISLYLFRDICSWVCNTMW